MTKIKMPFYFHQSKDSNWERLYDEQLALTQEAQEIFAYTGYEIRLDCELDTTTGEVYAYALESVKLERPVRI